MEDDTASNSSGLFIVEEFKDLYGEHLGSVDTTTFEGLKTKTKILENYDRDLTDQNKYLLQTVEELESEALKRLQTLEDNLTSKSDLIKTSKSKFEVKQADPENHDQILALRHEVQRLENQLTKANMQTCFKDDIIRELREEVKVAQSKETLTEVRFKEHSQSQTEQLTKQLKAHEQTIKCLRAELQQHGSSTESDRMFQIKQHVEWVLDNIYQQCAQANVSNEFTKCIMTMLEELRESVECCSLRLSSPTEPCKDPSEFIAVLHQSIEQSQDELNHSWASIRDTAHELSKIELSTLVDQWRVFLSKHCALQELFRSIIELVCKPKSLVGTLTKNVEDLHCILTHLSNELNSNCQNGFNSWSRKMQHFTSASIAKIGNISNVTAEMRCKQDELIDKLEGLAEREFELKEQFFSEKHAYDELSKLEKSQRVKVDSLLATVLHHQELWYHHKDMTRDLGMQIKSLNANLKNPATQSPNKQQPMGRPVEHVKHLVSKISAGLRNSLSDIEQWNSQVNNLEAELGEVRTILELAQIEIHKVTRGSHFKELDRKLMCLLHKLKKQMNNAITKADGLVDIYMSASNDFFSSTEHLQEVQKDVDSLEEEIKNICNDFLLSFPKECEEGVCSSKAELKQYKNRVKNLTNKIDIFFEMEDNKYMCQDGVLPNQYKQMKKALAEKDMALGHIRNNIAELRESTQGKEKLTEKQDQTIRSLQKSLKLCQREVEGLHKKLLCMESNKADSEMDYKNRILELQNKLSDLQECLKQSDKATEKSEVALRVFVSDFKESMAKKENETSHLQMKICELKEQLDCTKKAYQAECEVNNNKNLEQSQSLLRTCQLEKEVQQWKNKFSEVDAQLKEMREEMDNLNQHEKKSQLDNVMLNNKLKEELSEKKMVICKLTDEIKSMTHKLKETTINWETEKEKTFESEKHLQSVCAAYEEIKIKMAEREATVEKLQSALTQLSGKLASRRLDGVSLSCLKHFQEECAKFEALYNAAAYKLRSKEEEIAGLKSEIERLQNEAGCMDGSTLPEQEDGCPLLFGRVQQLSRELQVAHSCHLDCEARLKELTDTSSSKEKEIGSCKEEILILKAQLKRVTLQRDKLLMDLDKAQGEIVKLKMDNSDLLYNVKKLENAKLQNFEQMNKTRSRENMCDNCLSMEAQVGAQREISNALTSQMRAVKQKLHSSRHAFDELNKKYNKLQTSYEELSNKYNKLLGRAERDEDLYRPVCHPCTAKPSKSLAHFRHQEFFKSNADVSAMKISQSESWHKMNAAPNQRHYEKKWKDKLRDVMTSDDFEGTKLIMRNSSHSY